MPAGLDGNPVPMVTAARNDVLAIVAGAVMAQRTPGKPMLVAIDGIDGSGKTTFADELAERLAGGVGSILRATVDSFHRPRRDRWRRGKASPVGFYLDSHDLAALQAELLAPLKAGAGERYRTEVFDEPSDSPIRGPQRIVAANDLLVFDGIFAQRLELSDYWDLTVWLDGQARVDLYRLGLVMTDLPSDPVAAVGHALEWQQKIDRYSSGMRYYLDLVDPIQSADIVIDNNNLAHPRIIRRH